MKKIASQLLWPVCWLILSLWALYLLGAFYFDMSLGLPAGVTVALFFALIAGIVLRYRGRGRIVLLVSVFALITLCWLTITPSHDREWNPLKAVLPSVEFNGDKVTIRNVRDFNFTRPNEFTPAYVDRTIDLSKISVLDMYVNWWGAGGWVAHPMLSWRFEDSPPKRTSDRDWVIIEGGQQWKPLA